MKILVTGGIGYIGSHTCVELLKQGMEVVVFDNLYNAKIDVVDKIKEITGKEITFYQADMRDKESMRPIFEENKIDAVIHFAGLKAVGESVEKPLLYYQNNPYGTTKLMLEQILTDFCKADTAWHVILLRYFNPIGAHESGLIGESPNGIPNNLMPYITQVAIGKLPYLRVFGDDYDTPDGTGVRDYIHVVDLAKGHVNAVEAIMQKSGVSIYNLGTGIGYSVLDIVKAFEKANGITIPYQIQGRRAGDIAVCYANAQKAYEELGWKAEYDLERMCKDAWHFVQKNDKA